MRFSSTSTTLAVIATLASAALAAPSQMILKQDSSINREPDLIDIMESEATAAAADLRQGNVAKLSSVADKLWPPSTPPSPTPGGGWVWSSCGALSDPVQIESISVSPDPPVPGKNMTVTAKGHLSGTLEDGAYADVSVKLGLIKLLQRKFDICEEAKANNVSLQCPVQEGTHEVTHTVELPREIPPAKFNVHINGYSKDEEDLMCLDLSIDFRHH